ncbi:MAG: acyl--CoA ligase [Acidobacteria bacterium]|nr:acyl--CoA ligase [Acidobacteriota bacterium]
MMSFLDALAGHDPSGIALVDAAEQLSYGELRRRAGQVAAVLTSRHGTGGFMLLRADSSAASVTTLIGIMYSGNTPVPISPDLPAPALEFIRQKSGAVVTLTPLAADTYQDAQPEDRSDCSRPALVMFTSGTTGFPKGVIVSHANLAHSCHVIAGYLEYRRYPSAAVVLPLHYSYALLSQVFCQLSVGGRVHLFSDLRNPAKLARIITASGLETLCGVPSSFHALTAFHSMVPLSMPSVRVLCSAGAPMDRSRFNTIKEIFPNATFFNNYGMTEAAPRIAFIREDDPRFHEATCGKPMDGVAVKIVDPLTHDELAEGEQGMLVVRGPNVTAGYLNDPDLTRAAFTADGYLLSGDAAFMRDGYIFISGRYDDIFNCGGEKVAPGEIERVLNGLGAVEMSAVVGQPDEQRGMVPVAFMKLAHPVTRPEIVAELGTQLPPVKIPQRYYEVSGFPMTDNGKLQRRQLSPESPHVTREIR